MNELIVRCLNKLRYLYSHNYPGLLPNNIHLNNAFDYQRQLAGDYIKDLLTSDQPCMISRFGTSEIAATIVYYNIIDQRNFLHKSLLYIKGKLGYFWWDKAVVYGMCNNAGFFPAENRFLHQFGERMIQDIQHIDVLGSWIDAEQIVSTFLKDAVRVPLQDLEPYYYDHPWSEALKGKTVLVIHPFEQSIQNQYRKRHLLFKDARVLPDFDLKTLKAVQSIAENNVIYQNWFDAFADMCEQIENTKFDIAIIGAGAYGLPLAAFVKKIGKKAVHLGGATQILFGIRGARWDERPFFQQLFNEHWVRPLASEIPQRFTAVEGGCYW